MRPVWDHERGLVVDADTGEVLGVIVDERPPVRQVHGWQVWSSARGRAGRGYDIIVSFKVDAEMYNMLSRAAEMFSVSRSEVIRLALRRFFASVLGGEGRA